MRVKTGFPLSFVAAFSYHSSLITLFPHPFSRIAFPCARTRKGASRHKGVCREGARGLVCAASREGVRLRCPPKNISPRRKEPKGYEKAFDSRSAGARVVSRGGGLRLRKGQE